MFAGQSLGVLIAAFVIGALGSARVARLIGFDTYPPIAWLRSKWDAWTEHSEWNKLVHCPYCSTPYIAAANLTWAYCTELQTAWWITNILLAGAYAAAYFVVYDGDDD